jgi:hypothetical protein
MDHTTVRTAVEAHLRLRGWEETEEGWTHEVAPGLALPLTDATCAALALVFDDGFTAAMKMMEQNLQYHREKIRRGDQTIKV